MKTIAVALSAGAPHSGNTPTIQQPISSTETVLNWQLRAIDSDLTYIITGYQSDLVQNVGENQTVVENPEWSQSGSAYSLLMTPFLREGEGLEGKELIVFYGDVLFRSDFIKKIRKSTANLTIAWDSHTDSRKMEKPSESEERVVVREGKLERSGVVPDYLSNGKFVGLVRFTGKGLSLLRDISLNRIDEFKKASLADLVEAFRIEGLEIAATDIEGDWAEVGADSGVVRFVLGTKAESLERLRGLITQSKIEEQVHFSVADWRSNKGRLLTEVKIKFGSERLIVRSSARSEDSFTHSNAGAYTSLLNVDPINELENAIEEVISSYDNLQLDDQVLVQPMLKDVISSGVVFTRSLEHGAPYYVINYDETGTTDGITAGNNNEHKTLIIRRDAKPEQVANQKFLSLQSAVKEVEDLLNFDSLDIEFAITKSSESDVEIVHILQVRPIAVTNESASKEEDLFNKRNKVFAQAEALWRDLSSPPAHVVGETPIYGIMPDWNPAEIIGTNPGKLAESLYKYLIMDEVWATHRAQYGYRDVRPQPLLVSFAGKPYVDVRASFNSFIPRNINNEDAEKLVSFYLQYLKSNPKLHDKVEFEVLPTCVGPSFYSWEKRLEKEGGITPSLISELKEGLLNVSRHAIDKTKDYLKDVEVLQARNVHRRNHSLDVSIRNIRSLLDECRLFGTLPFAHLARSGFIAATLLKEGVKEAWLSQKAMDDFMASLRTVSHDLTEDAKATARGKMAWKEFVSKYGHLRPGTYDITSPAYSDDPERFLRPIVNAAMSTEHVKNVEDEWAQQKSSFFRKVRELGLDYSDDVLERFLRDAIEGRELAKFVFSQNLSQALHIMSLLTDTLEIEINEWANLSIYDVLSLDGTRLSKIEQRNLLRTKAQKNIEQRFLDSTCELPALITSIDDFYSFELTAGVPNFIGSKRVIARCVHIQAGAVEERVDVQGAVVLIPQADPGFDWLFGQGIAGLITMYGGANSHMAIRSAEFGLPAAIGIGEQLYKQFLQVHEIELDPANSLMRAIR